MAELVTTATIRAKDMLTGPLLAMASRVRAVNNQFATGAGRLSRAGTQLGVGMGMGAYGFGALLNVAEDFNKSIFGVGVASVTDAMDATGKIDVSVPLKQMMEMEQVALDMSAAMGFSARSIADIGETLAKAGMKSDRLTDAMRATASLAKTDFESDPKKMAEYLNTLSVIHKPRSGEGFGDFLKRQADMTYAAAAETQLSTGSIVEGMKQFQTIGAGMGLETEQMLAFLMAGARRGFNATEFGTALKSDMVRSIKMTAEGQAAMSALNLDMSRYATQEAQDPTRALSGLNRATAGLASGKDGAKIRAKLLKAQREGYTTSTAFIDEITNDLVKAGNKKGRAYSAEDRNDLRIAVQNAITTTSGKFNLPMMIADLASKGLNDDQIGKLVGETAASKEELEQLKQANPNANDAQLASIWEGRQLARNKALIEAIRSGEYAQDLQLLRQLKGQGLEAVETLWSKSAFGNLKSMEAAFQRIGIRLANSPGIQQFVNWLERMAKSLEQLDPKMVDFTARALAIGAIAAPAMLAAGGLIKLGGAALAAMLGVGRLVSGPLTRLGALLGGGALVRGVGGIVGMLTRLSAVGLVFGAGAVIYQNLDAFRDALSTLGASEGFKTLLVSLDRMWEAAKGLGAGLADVAQKLLSLFGIKLDASSIVSAIEAIMSALTAVINGIARATEGLAALTKMKVLGSSSGAFGNREPTPPSVPSLGEMATGLSPADVSPGSSTNDLQQIDVDGLRNATGDLSGSASSLNGTAAALQGLPEALAAAVREGARQGIEGANLNVNVSGGGGGGGKASAPAVTKSNGSNYGGQ